MDKVSIIEVAGNTISQTHKERITYTRTQIKCRKKNNNKDGTIFESNKSGKIELDLKFEKKKKKKKNTKMNFGFFTALQGGYIVI